MMRTQRRTVVKAGNADDGSAQFRGKRRTGQRRMEPVPGLAAARGHRKPVQADAKGARHRGGRCADVQRRRRVALRAQATARKRFDGRLHALRRRPELGQEFAGRQEMPVQRVAGRGQGAQPALRRRRVGQAERQRDLYRLICAERREVPEIGRLRDTMRHGARGHADAQRNG